MHCEIIDSYLNARVLVSKPVYQSPKWPEYITGIYTQITMFDVNLTTKTLKTLLPSNLFWLFYVKIIVVTDLASDFS